MTPLKKLQKKLDELGPLGLVNNRAYSKFLTVEKQRQKSTAALVYKELWRVEQAFHNLKSDLELRPMYHQKRAEFEGISWSVSWR